MFDELASQAARAVPITLQATTAIGRISVLQSIISNPFLGVYLGMNATLALSARFGGGNIWTGTLVGSKVSVPNEVRNIFPISIPASVARYNLNAKSATGFVGEWLFLLGGVSSKEILPESSEGNNTYSTINSFVTLYTPPVSPDSGGSFAGVVIFLSIGSGRGTSFESFIAGSGFGEIARTSKTPFASLSGLVGLSIYLPNV
jgi:hypothetical protein